MTKRRDTTTNLTMILLSSLLIKECHAFVTGISKTTRPLQTATKLFSAVAEADERYLRTAIEHARNGFGHTYPNPAVGCLIVRQDSDEVIGAGFHPKAGFPHAEVFALLEAAGHVESGVIAAQSVLQGNDNDNKPIQDLFAKYSSEGGPEELFGNSFEDIPVTAYVTLEPCCHYGRTPPCAVSLAMSKVDRVVVGLRDPNPRVDGGGVKLLQDSGVQVDMAEGDVNGACADLVSGFVKRITPRENTDFTWITGTMRRALRSLAESKKATSDLSQVNWNGDKAGDSDESVDCLTWDASWIERLDSILWEYEIVNLRLNRAVGKKKLAKRLGERIASELDAHVAQTKGHTVLLYRPAIPPILDLPALVEQASTKTQQQSRDDGLFEI